MDIAGRSLVYFSSVSENTHRFVQKLGIPATRIPLHGRIEVDEPYVLILPTYGGGRANPGLDAGGYVPKQVIAFLNNDHNRAQLRGSSLPAIPTSVPSSATPATSSPENVAFPTYTASN